MNVFFTSDHHFGHANIIRFCDRPFATIEEMDVELVWRWNDKVKPDDIVYHLGDFTLGDEKVAAHYFSQLNGLIYVLNNYYHHDKRWLRIYEVGKHLRSKDHPVHVIDSLTVLGEGWTGWRTIESRPTTAIVLCHYAMRVWDRSHYGSWHLYGHSHGRLEPHGFSMDVGVDVPLADFTPISLGTVVKLMTTAERLTDLSG